MANTTSKRKHLSYIYNVSVLACANKREAKHSNNERIKNAGYHTISNTPEAKEQNDQTWNYGCTTMLIKKMAPRGWIQNPFSVTKNVFNKMGVPEKQSTIPHHIPFNQIMTCSSTFAWNKAGEWTEMHTNWSRPTGILGGRKKKRWRCHHLFYESELLMASNLALSQSVENGKYKQKRSQDVMKVC